MAQQFDLVLTGARVVDPVAGVDRELNLGITKGRVAELSTRNMNAAAKKVLPLDGLTILPGIIDIHTHISRAFGTAFGGCRMLARAGVTTTMEMSGPALNVFKIMRDYGAGINVGVLEGINPGVNFPGPDADEAAVDAFISKAMDDGALGTKILGGHYPLTPETNHRVVSQTRKQGGRVAWHCGSTATDNTIVAVREFFEITKGHSVHLAHVNSYCRGLRETPLEEVAEALKLLEANPNIYCESYIASTNGTRLTIDPNGRCLSRATGDNIAFLGFEDSAQGMEAAIRAGSVHVFVQRGLEIDVVTGKAGANAWLEAKSDIGGGMHINPAAPRMALYLAKNAEGRFIVDALSTDGGIIPRNNIVSDGLGLVKAGALTLNEFVLKSCVNPAKLLNLPQKGHLSLGADADITVVDPAACEPVSTIVGGNVVMHQGLLLGKGGTIITTERGRARAASFGLPLVVVDHADGPLPLYN